VLLDSPDKLKKLNQFAYLAVIPVIALSLFRAYSGVSWNIKYEAEDMRAVSYATAPILFWVFYDASSRLLIRTKGTSGFKDLMWVGVVGFTLLISNYRALWLVPVMGLIVLILSAKLNGMMRIGRILLAGILLASAGILVILVLRSVFRDIFGLIETKFIEDVLGFEWEGSFRYFSWGEAWSQFQTHPLLGVGIGHRLNYWLLNRFGEYYMRESTAHNIFIDYFYQTGLVGGLLYILPHALFTLELWRPLRRIPIEYSRPALALFVTYFSMFALGALQPFLTIPSVVVLLYILMGVASRWVYWGKRADREALREDCVV
jgi:O-antigen ligase